VRDVSTAVASYAILDHVPNGCVVIGADGSILFWNQAIERSSGRPRSGVLRKNVFAEFPALSEPRYRLRIDQTLACGTPCVFSALLTDPMFHVGSTAVDRRYEQVTVTRTTPNAAARHEVLFTVTDVTEQQRRGERFRSESRRAAVEAGMRRTSEDQLRIAMESAEAATRAKSLFLASMSHELRTPMNGVLGMCDLLLESRPTRIQREYLEILGASASSLLTVLNDILDFSKIEANKLELEEIAYDPRRIVEESICLMAEIAQAKDLECLAIVAPDVPETVTGDPIRFRQVLMNLLSNAVKFTAVGEVVACLEATSEGGEVILRCAVRDTGPGMPEETRARLFEPFVQANSAISRVHGGTGLGLSICRRLVHLMGGDIRVASELGRGSEFGFEVRARTHPNEPRRARSDVRVGIGLTHPSATRALVAQLASRGVVVRELTEADLATPASLAGLTHVVVDAAAWSSAGRTVPLAGGPRFVLGRRASSAASATPEGFSGVLSLPCRRSAVDDALGVGPRPDLLPEAAVRNTLAGLRILVAEDNSTNQIVARAMLSKLGCSVRVVDDGGAAITAALEGKFDLILMDMQMPVVDGLTATTQLRERGHAGPIVALTANALAQDRAACLAAGMNDFLPKPIDRAALIAILERWAPSRANDPSAIPMSA